MEGGSHTGDFERRMKEDFGKRSISLCGSFMRGTWKDGPITGDPERYTK